MKIRPGSSSCRQRRAAKARVPLGQPIPRHVPRVGALDQLRQHVPDRLHQPHVDLRHPQRHHIRLLEPPLDAAPPPELVHGQVQTPGRPYTPSHTPTTRCSEQTTAAIIEATR
jgi:hypothetical protein